MKLMAVVHCWKFGALVPQRCPMISAYVRHGAVLAVQEFESLARPLVFDGSTYHVDTDQEGGMSGLPLDTMNVFGFGVLHRQLPSAAVQPSAADCAADLVSETISGRCSGVGPLPP